MNGGGDILQLAARLWVERCGLVAPHDEGELHTELEDASGLVKNPIIDALQRHGFEKLREAVEQRIIDTRI